ncbi:MAG TPA: DUF2785 domain-containing protein [Ideonella sp.]|jgi:hypothetical protein|nr:DUF2785 domain-containing protein [Ideonella sp.]
MSCLSRALVAIALAVGAGWASAACPPEGMSRNALLAVRNNHWLVDDARREALALSLVDCLADPDPVLRDEVGFEGLQHWMRANQLPSTMVRRIGDQLLRRVTRAAVAADGRGVVAPFAALTLAEVARVDRLTPLYSPPERDAFVTAAATYLGGVRDYRGFDAQEGWRHGVAHGADWALQLSLNTALDRPQLDRLLDAISTQVLPPGEQNYIYGEGQRLMAPVFYIAKRGLHDTAFWTSWLGRISGSAAPSDGQPTAASLARMHNAREFIWPLYAAVQESTDEGLRQRLLPGLKAAVKALP